MSDTNNKDEALDTLGICRLMKNDPRIKEKGYKLDDIKLILEVYSEMVYKCLLNGVKVPLPKLGWFKKKYKKGMSARKMSIPLHPFTEDKSYRMVEYPKQPDYSVIEFTVRNKVGKAFREKTTVKE